MSKEYLCGFNCWHPKWMQKFATTRTFIAVYGFLGTIQAIGFVYIIVTLTTLERRFKIPSYTTGLMLAGNEISQILLSMILSYFGGHQNRPRWLAWGVVFSAISCFILASPHLIYGPGDDALKLTKEFQLEGNQTLLFNSTTPVTLSKNTNRLCLSKPVEKECVEVLASILPIVLIFISQFVLGIGNTLYFTLGQTYIDDNTDKTKTPMMLGYAAALRTLGPVIGFGMGYVCLKVYIDPTKTPLIDSKDPRWLGAWWLGWIILGFTMLIFASLLALFPRELPKQQKKNKKEKRSSEIPKFMSREELSANKKSALDMSMTDVNDVEEIPRLKDMPQALMRLVRNKILLYNILSSVFYILGSTGYITFLSKYIEVQFHRAMAEATMITGPVTLIGIVSGLLISGKVISKYKPRASKLLFWNVIVGCCYMAGQFSYLFFTCPDGKMPLVEGGRLNLTTNCNAHCSCDGIAYNPVCYEATGVTYFSSCHAGCSKWNPKGRFYHSCDCAGNDGPPKITHAWNQYDHGAISTTDAGEIIEFVTANPELAGSEYETDTEPIKSRRRRAIESTTLSPDDKIWGKMIPGACLKGCGFGFLMFTAISVTINILGSSGRIGNILVNFRAVKKEDKSFTQGLILMMISLFAFIPGPIVYGKIIDSTCLVWTEECGKRGNCQLYDQKSFRYYINFTAMIVTFFGVFFDVLVWWYGRNLDLYGDRENEQEQRNKLKKSAS
uniref:Solute carrier organic anion transporter family member n=1 Tax=Corethrella appendiculata TaxID=1370023 RepID=U5EK85_9DIPT